VTVSEHRPRKKPRLWLGADGEVLLMSVSASSEVKEIKERPQLNGA
jgi:hypothetical protein